MASFQSFQVEPLTEKFVCYAKLPTELLQYLAGRKSGDKSSITIKFDAQQNVFVLMTTPTLLKATINQIPNFMNVSFKTTHLRNGARLAMYRKNLYLTKN